MGKLRNTASICDYIVNNSRIVYNQCYNKETNTFDAKKYIDDFKAFMGEIGFYFENSLNQNIINALWTGRTEKYQYCNRLYSSNDYDKCAEVALYFIGYIKDDKKKAELVNDLSITYDIALKELAKEFGVKRFVTKDIDYKKSDIISIDGKQYEVMNDFEKETREYGHDALEVLSYGTDRYENRYLNANDLDNSALVKRGMGKTSIEIRNEERKANYEKLSKVLVEENVVRVDYILENLKMATMNKNSTLEEYKIECEKPKIREQHWDYQRKKYIQLTNWEIITAHIKGEIHLSQEDYDLFSTMLLDDFPMYLNKNYNGNTLCFYEDKDLEKYKNGNSFTDEYYDFINSHSYPTNCLAVYVGDKLGFVTDGSGYTYARYVYLPINQTKKSSTKDLYAKFNEEYQYPFPIDENGIEIVQKVQEQLPVSMVDEIVSKIEALLVNKYGLTPVVAKEEVAVEVKDKKPSQAKKVSKSKGKKEVPAKFNEMDEISNGYVVTEVLGNGMYEVCDTKKETFENMSYDDIIKKFFTE